MTRTIRGNYPLCGWLLAGLAWTALGVIPLASGVGQSAEEASVLSAADAEFFEKQVRPLLVQHCFECHSAEKASGGLDLETRAGTLRGGDTGVAWVAGEPDASLLVQAVRYDKPDLQMPPKQALSAAEIAVFEKWIERGAPDPRALDAGGAPKPTGMGIEDGRQFWSLQPVAAPAVPEVKNRDWVRTPIDAFILAGLEQRGLEPAPPADKRTLIRRATFDLIGLPPTPEDVEAFLADDSPDAFSRVVERLLQSPRYGIRWARHWLDVVRYADSNGLDENLAFGNAWRYRDYVVDAFNANKPFDRFVMEQVAGDLLPDASLETRIATGFLVLGAKVLAEPDRAKLDMDTIDEQIDTLGKVFLGMTLGCVRCHDHKFDPIKQADYYALAAILKSTHTFGTGNYGAIKYWNEYVFATPEDKEALKKVDEEIAAKKQAAASFKSTATAQVRAAARAKAAEYLAAAATFEPGMPVAEVEAIAGPLGLHTRILHHCRLHLEYHQDDPLFAKWHECKAAGDTEAIRTHYAALFAEADAAWAAAKEADAAVKTLADPQLEAARSALDNPTGLLAVSPQPEFALDEATLAEYYRLAEEARVLESAAPDEPSAMAVSEGKIQPALPIHIRGSHLNLGEPVTRNFPAVFRAAAEQAVFPRDQSGRLQLAQWLASTQNPLTARVTVNRIWGWHFGVALVPSTENFGALGDRPSHPELLDWLARNFMEAHWSMKDLQRQILLSNSYQMAAVHPHEQPETGSLEPLAPRAQQVDPENRWLWKFRRRRLDAEQLRDAILYVAGQLDETPRGKSVPLRNRQFVFDHTSIDHTRYDSRRRALYLPVIRNNVYGWFEQFDFPDPTMPTGSRSETTVAPQALLLMNMELVMDAATQMARNLISHHDTAEPRIAALFASTLGRGPTPAESQRVTVFLQQQIAESAEPGTAELQAWALVCQSLMASNEFVYVR
jgi:hypothetical protein